MIASRKRLILAAYIDFLIIASVITLVRFVFVPNLADSISLIVAAAVAVICVFVFKKISMGRYILSISSTGLVPETIKKTENYWTMGIALYLMLDGTKQMVRWTQLSPWPLFGYIPEGITSVISVIFLGSVSALCGYLIFKLKKQALMIAIGYVALNFVNFLMSKSLWLEVITKKQIERRQIQGLSADKNEIEMLQNFFLPSVTVVALFIVIILIMNRKRFIF